MALRSRLHVKSASFPSVIKKLEKLSPETITRDLETVLNQKGLEQKRETVGTPLRALLKNVFAVSGSQPGTEAYKRSMGPAIWSYSLRYGLPPLFLTINWTDSSLWS